jgi:Anti-sigma-K factor rskA
VSGPPEFRDLVGNDLPAEELARLERVHELLQAAGPPPELPPSLADVPDPAVQAPSWLPRRRLGAVLALAAAIATIAFLGGYLAGYRHSTFDVDQQVAMRGTSGAPGASGLIKLGKRDDAGNWPMVVTVRGLPRLPKRGYYELYLTRKGKPVVPCGSFTVDSGATNVKFTVPYSLRRYDGWVVTVQDPGKREPGPVILRT